MLPWYSGYSTIQKLNNCSTSPDGLLQIKPMSVICTDRRLAAYGGSSFEPILQAFHQEDFIALVQQSLDNWKARKNQYKSAMLIKQSKIILAFLDTYLLRFVVDHAPFFAETCMDGSHPLVWTQYHDAYKDIFETRLAQILQGIEVVQEDFASFCEWLKVNADIFDDDTEGLYPFLSSITASLEPCQLLEIFLLGCTFYLFNLFVRLKSTLSLLA